MKNMLNEFREFALRGNVMDLAIGVIIGAAFTGVVNSLVEDILMPPIGLLLGDVDFSDLFISLDGTQYASLAEAQLAGAPTINYGLFINTLINFLIVALVVFLIVRQMNNLSAIAKSKKDEQAPTEKNCPYCFTLIPAEAVKCPHCTSDLE